MISCGECHRQVREGEERKLAIGSGSVLGGGALWSRAEPFPHVVGKGLPGAGSGGVGRRCESHQVWTTLQGVSKKKNGAELGREAGIKRFGGFLPRWKLKAFYGLIGKIQ